VARGHEQGHGAPGARRAGLQVEPGGRGIATQHAAPAPMTTESGHSRRERTLHPEKSRCPLKPTPGLESGTPSFRVTRGWAPDGARHRSLITTEGRTSRANRACRLVSQGTSRLAVNEGQLSQFWGGDGPPLRTMSLSFAGVPLKALDRSFRHARPLLSAAFAFACKHGCRGFQPFWRCERSKGRP